MTTKKLISEPQQILLAWPLQEYEEESKNFFQDKSKELIADDTLARLLTFPNVLITSHQAFFTQEALHKIALTTLNNFKEFFRVASWKTRSVTDVRKHQSGKRSKLVHESVIPQSATEVFPAVCVAITRIF